MIQFKSIFALLRFYRSRRVLFAMLMFCIVNTKM